MDVFLNSIGIQAPDYHIEDHEDGFDSMGRTDLDPAVGRRFGSVNG